MKPILASSILALALGSLLVGCGSQEPAPAATTAASAQPDAPSGASHMPPEALAAKQAAGGK